MISYQSLLLSTIVLNDIAKPCVFISHVHVWDVQNIHVVEALTYSPYNIIFRHI